MIFFQLILSLLLLIVSVLAYFFFQKFKKAESVRVENEQRFQSIEDQFNSLQLKNLEQRLNPHLLKNILNSMQSHAYQTYFALDKLGTVLDYMLYESKKPYVTPKAEIEFAMNLIEINKIKISPLFDLSIKMKINEQDALYNQAVLAPLISVDLIENAFKHADLQGSDAFISVVFEFKNNQFIQIVSNKISATEPIRKENGGLGQEIQENRLNIIYKGFYELQRFVEGDVYVAQLKIDLFGHKNQMSTLG